MDLPFTVDEFLDVFRRYNEAVWPAQIALYAVAAAAIALAARRAPWAGRAISGILVALWLWMGLAYHLAFFRTINPAAVAFAVLFVGQAALFAWVGAWRGRLEFRPRADMASVDGGLLMLYALVVYPAVGYALGHQFPAAPTFGLPCPTTIFTFGLLAWTAPAAPRVVLVVPALWAVVGTAGAFQLGMREDFGLAVAAVVGTLAVSKRRTGDPARRRHRPPESSPVRPGPVRAA